MNKAQRARINPLFSMLQPYKYNPFRAMIINETIESKRKPKESKQKNGKVNGKAGRPTKMTAETISKLKYAYLIGCNDSMACFYSGISHNTLWEYKNRNPEFQDKINGWKENPKFQALHTVIKSVKNGDTNTAKWLLEKLEPKQYGNKLQVDHDHIHKLDDYQLEQLEQQILDQIAAAAGYIKLDDTQLIDVTPSE